MDIWHELDAFTKDNHIPFTVLIELTRRCNHDCIHCYNVKSQAELSFAEIQDIAGQLRQAGCLFLTLTGGEVFTRPRFLDEAAFLRGLGFDLKIFTNGTLITPKGARRLSKLAPSEIGISLLGATAQTHDRITRVSGSFAKTIDCIRRLKEYDLPVYIKCVLMKENISEYEGIICLAQELGVTYLVDPIISPRDDGSLDPVIHRLSEEQIGCFYRSSIEDLGDSFAPKQGFPCDAGSDFATISATGDVYPCLQIPIPVGNVFKESFKDIWTNAPLLNKIRQAGNDDFKECGACDLRAVCIRCPGYAYLEDGDLFGKSSLACFLARIHADVKRSHKKIAV